MTLMRNDAFSHVRLPRDLDERLARLAEKRLSSRSAIVREALARLLEIELDEKEITRNK